MKDIKVLLKEAREAIRNKQYDTSLKLCKRILKEDGNNCMALLFQAVSYQETGQDVAALNVLKNAVALHPSNTLALNGLIKYYERFHTSNSNEELVKTCFLLFEIETDDKKLQECLQKICDLCNKENMNELIPKIYRLIKSNKCSNISTIASSVLNVFSSTKNIMTLSSELLTIYEDLLRTAINDKKTVTWKYQADFLNLLYKQDRKDEVYSNAKQIYNLNCCDESTALKWICKIFNESYIETDSFIEEDDTILNYADTLSKIDSKCATVLLTKSILLIRNDNKIEAKKLLNEAVVILPGLLHAWILLMKCCNQMNLFYESIPIANKVDKLIHLDEKLKLKLANVFIYIMEALSRSSDPTDLNRVLELYKMCDDEINMASFKHIIRTYINLEQYDEAQSLLDHFKTRDENKSPCVLLQAEIFYKQMDYSNALTILEQETEPNSEWLIHLGIVYRYLNQQNKSLIALLKATKLDSTNYKCFFLLGQYYIQNNDLEKARRCLEKAFQLNNKSSEVGIELSNTYRSLNNWDANHALLQQLTDSVINKENSWIWMQLGLHYLERQDFEKAIINLRVVLRIEDNNINCWESLADAYLAKGAYTSALKCYEKVSKLKKNPLYASLQVATIKQILGEYVEAHLVFENILTFTPSYIPALKGITETYFLLARECLKQHRLGACKDHLQNAVDYVTIGIQEQNNFSCFWKLLADCCMLATNLSDKYCCLKIPNMFLEENDEESSRFLFQSDLYILADKCYQKSIIFTEDNALIWHDLAFCYLSQSMNTKDTQLSNELSKKAFDIARYCTSLNPAYWQHWNLLGNISVLQEQQNLKLAQHAFIKAVLADNNSAMSWCNLGTLYFLLDDYQLANEAYSQAQRADPNYVNSWIGQALLAETFCHHEAMDLFRHSTQLGFHNQGAIGYSHWVCKTLKETPMDSVVYSIHNMHAIPVACDAITLYMELNPIDSIGWNMLGILKERMGLKQGALEAFKLALHQASKENQDFIRVNYGRLLAEMGEYEKAIETFVSIETATFNSGAGLALTLFKDKRFKDSYNTYESTLSWLSDDSHLQSELLVALATMAYMFEGPDTAKTLLFQSLQLENASPWSFYAIFALGLLHRDFNLTKLVFDELKKFNDKSACASHVAILLSSYHLLQNNEISSVRSVCKAVHKHPSKGRLWYTLSSLLIRLRNTTTYSKLAAAKCALSSIQLNDADMEANMVLCVTSLSCFISGNTTDALRHAQKAVHCYPNMANTWSVLICVLQNVQKLTHNHLKNISAFAETLCKEETLKPWFKNLYIN